MSVIVREPDSTRVIHKTSTDFKHRNVHKPIHVVQYDKMLPVASVELFMAGESYALPGTASVKVRWGKRDGTFVYKDVYGCSGDRTTVYFEIDEQMTFFSGEYYPILEVIINGLSAGSSPIPVVVDRNPIQEDDIESAIVMPLAPVAFTGSYNDLSDKPTDIGGSITPYDPYKAYSQFDVYIYDGRLGVTTVSHGPEEFNEAHNSLQAKKIELDGCVKWNESVITIATAGYGASINVDDAKTRVVEVEGYLNYEKVQLDFTIEDNSIVFFSSVAGIYTIRYLTKY